MRLRAAAVEHPFILIKDDEHCAVPSMIIGAVDYLSPAIAA